MKASLFALLSFALVACADEPPVDSEPSEASALVAPKEGKGAKRPAPPRSCDDLQQQARSLLAGFQGCTEDADCTVERVAAPCLAPFLCQVSIGRDAGLAQLTRQAASLSLSYRRTCGDQCPVARCASPENLHAFCDPETKRCSSELRLPSSDAGAADPVAPDADAGVPPAP